MSRRSVRLLAAAGACALLGLAPDRARAQDSDPFDAIESALAFNSPSGAVRAQLSGLLDLDGYAFSQPPPGFLYSDASTLLAPRLALFLDAQLGPAIYLFAQSRADRGFDPNSDLRGQFRLDEYAVRFSPGGGQAFHLQLGKFATIVGNWTPRHDSWTDPFVTAPLPYDNLTGIWDAAPVRSTGMLLDWAHLRPYSAFAADPDKALRLPIIWGPSYTTGAAVAGAFGPFSYAAEIKNTALSSRPGTWQPTATGWRHPATSLRLAYAPDEAWTFGVSASQGVYLRPSAESLLAPTDRFGAHRQIVLGQDAAFAWHHVQLWAEAYEARFVIPGVTNADTVAYYLEGRYQLLAQLALAARWNQQLYGTVPYLGVPTAWGRNVDRTDLAAEYRFSAHLQLKLQYSLQTGDPGWPGYGHLFASELTLRF